MKKTNLSHIDLIDSSGKIISNNKGSGIPPKKVFTYTKDGVLFSTYNSIEEASEVFKSSISIMRSWCQFGLLRRNLFWSYHFPFRQDRIDYRVYLDKINKRRRKKNAKNN